jgi:branched-subunit amino acid aminotransferase/4-amino-4-deoxychorismate lyase
VREGLVTPAMVRGAREVFVTNALVGIRPLAAIDAIRLPAPGPVTARLRQAWEARFGAD